MSLENTYAAAIAQIKTEIETIRLRAAISVNQHLLILYWKIGNIILEQQNNEGWGTKVIERLSNDLRKEFPDMKGTSARNLKYMRAFAAAYPEFVQLPVAQIQDNSVLQQPAAKLEKTDNSIVQVPLAQLESASIVQEPLAQLENDSILQVPLAKLTWYHHITLMDKVKDGDERIFYIKKSVENGWSRNVLVHQIEGKLYHRQGKAISNFTQTLPSFHSDLAKEMLKDPYKFDFLNLSEEYFEKDLEDALVNHSTKFFVGIGCRI